MPLATTNNSTCTKCTVFNEKPLNKRWHTSTKLHIGKCHVIIPFSSLTSRNGSKRFSIIFVVGFITSHFSSPTKSNTLRQKNGERGSAIFGCNKWIENTEVIVDQSNLIWIWKLDVFKLVCKVYLHWCGLNCICFAMAEHSATKPHYETNDAEMKGFLLKWTNYIKGYQRRWFVLSDGVLSYYRCDTPIINNNSVQFRNDIIRDWWQEKPATDGDRVMRSVSVSRRCSLTGLELKCRIDATEWHTFNQMVLHACFITQMISNDLVEANRGLCN